MTVDKLFDGSDAHLLPGNAELIEPPHEIICYALKVGDWFKERDITHWKIADCASRNALEAADKRIAELEAELQKRAKQIGVACMTHDLTHSLACGRCLTEAERKLAVAREALKETTDVLEILRRGHGVDVGSKCYPAINIAREALAQIGGDDEQT